MEHLGQVSLCPSHYCKGCLSSNSPVPPLTTFPTTRQAEGETNWSREPAERREAGQTPGQQRGLKFPLSKNTEYRRE